MYSFPLYNFVTVKDLSAQDVNYLLDRANKYFQINRQLNPPIMESRGLTQINLFLETSTRTQTSFEIAGKLLGLNVININIKNSSMKKGENIADTIATLNATRPNIIVIRHPCSGAINSLIHNIEGTSIINAGDGTHEHPSQALLDAFAIRHFKGQISNLHIAICGDILHSRVARSNIILLNAMGARVRVIAPITLLPTNISHMGVEVFHDMKKGLKDVDVIIILRMQQERMSQSLVPSMREYRHMYSLDNEKLQYAKKEALVMHPGPINRNCEISSCVANGSQSIIQYQVEIGIAIRMAIIEALIANQNNIKKKEL
ncbi:aspartate carbamoyltransferase catalytic subunit [Candidatus Liberibacter africanus]|uniref:Aspartate carbamoyltransferase n=1 Tax=Candidatus Liberibacter africanus PTSAPSY TaxID=1277257 RepID=A0A0G3I1W8_LIBAF|nr:aspartate carbamoyltransferase catalytic subunit [Candidatus Liberibacter africanus]AKK19869.1 aspartate carbamoyltransferase catalytic subunit [Candidatus Liberibacter africanus PTSAPSY]QTP63725.1 aspartate carbamoyltransferase catalytic subunit [Candidatus Liberibacter africanus]